MSGFSPYTQAAQQQSQQQYQQMSPYSMGYGGRYGMFSRYRPNLSGAVTGPTGNGGTGGGEMEENRQAAQAQMANRGAAADSRIASEVAGGQANAAQNAQGIKDYRQVRDSGIGRDNLNTSNDQRQQATALGIDPSSDAHDIAAAASGPIQPGADGRMSGGDTGNGSLTPGSAGVATAAAAAQNAKDGGAAAQQANAYAGGYNAASPTAPATSFAAGAPSPAMPAMPQLTLNTPPAANPGTVTPPAVGSSAAPATPGQPALPKPNAPLPASQIKPFGNPTDTAKYGPALSGGTTGPVVQRSYPRGPGTVGTSVLAPNSIQGQFKTRIVTRRGSPFQN